jgi:dTDP-4-dehydrorhamnose 3,5-epimerase
MNFTKTNLEDVLVVEPAVFGDHRGWFMETYSEAKFQEQNINYQFVQDNQSYSAVKGTLRGLIFN